MNESLLNSWLLVAFFVQHVNGQSTVYCTTVHTALLFIVHYWPDCNTALLHFAPTAILFIMHYWSDCTTAPTALLPLLYYCPYCTTAPPTLLSILHMPKLFPNPHFLPQRCILIKKYNF